MGLNLVKQSSIVVTSQPAKNLPFGGKRHTLTQADRIKGARKAAETRAAKKAAAKLEAAQARGAQVEQRNSGSPAPEAKSAGWPGYKSQIHERFNYLTTEPTEQMYEASVISCSADTAAARLALDLPGLRLIGGIDGFQWCVTLVHRETRSKVCLLGNGNSVLIATEHSNVPTTLLSDLDLIIGRVTARIA